MHMDKSTHLGTNTRMNRKGSAPGNPRIATDENTPKHAHIDTKHMHMDTKNTHMSTGERLLTAHN